MTLCQAVIKTILGGGVEMETGSSGLQPWGAMLLKLFPTKILMTNTYNMVSYDKKQWLMAPHQALPQSLTQGLEDNIFV